MIGEFPGLENPATLWRMPEAIYRGLVGYVEHGDCGGFLAACLANDFTAAVCRADDESVQCLRPIAKFIHCEMPVRCHGSKQLVAEWRKAKRAERELAAS